MAASKGKPRLALGMNPLSQGIFNKTNGEATPSAEKPLADEDAINEGKPLAIAEQNQQQPTPTKRIKNQESRFLANTEKEKVNLRLPIKLNDWLDDLLKKGKRQHGHKIAKEVWVQAALEFFQTLPINWQDVDSEESLRDALISLESRIKNLD